MTAHPCVGHACDHCYLCDVLGVCCSTVSADQRAQLEAGHEAQSGALHTAVVLEAGTGPSLIELVRLEAEKPNGAQRLLPAAPAQAEPIDARKGAVNVVASRTAG
jgi:hypothetical protein